MNNNLLECLDWINQGLILDLSGWMVQFKTFKMLLLKIKPGCLNGNYYGLLNYSRIVYFEYFTRLKCLLSKMDEIVWLWPVGGKEYTLICLIPDPIKDKRF